MKLICITIGMALCCQLAYAQKVIVGKVIDSETGNALAGATITHVKKTTVSDRNGFFTIAYTTSAKTQLVVTYVGYEPWLYSHNPMTSDTLMVRMLRAIFMTDEVIVTATRAASNTPMTFTHLDKETITQNNLGKDIPYLLELTPSVVTTSDAGGGVGYTGIRIRGSDATRVNVTLNGIPYNDSESQGVFWVDLPDFASSVESIQIQRGVGTSTNGQGAFGASINIQTTGLNRHPYASIDNSFGSFNTRKHTVSLGTGLINNAFAVDGRLSQISSDGYIDRATSDLKSFYLSGGYYGKKTLLKFNVFSGKEITYQSWFGTPESRINNDLQDMQEHIVNNGLDQEEAENLLTSGRTYNFYTYANQVDNYKQTHYQLIYAFDLTNNITWNTALHFTNGRGFFEEFKKDQTLSDYGISGPTIGGTTVTNSDLIRRRWLNNDFYGFTFSLDYSPDSKTNFILGGAWNTYDGDHFGEVIWAEFAGNSQNTDHYYDNNGEKFDFTTYAKLSWDATDQLTVFGDLQYHAIDYSLAGQDNDRITFDESHHYDFFNPKAGISYAFSSNTRLYASFAIGAKEPSRSDFVDTPDLATPKAEKLRNLEVGVNRKADRYEINANYYYMDYKNQLVLTGELNDVGAPLRTNVEDSYRMGIELSGKVVISPSINVHANSTFSRNIIRQFDDVLYNFGVNWDEYIRETTPLEDTHISFSPEIIAGGTIEYHPAKRLSLRWAHRYVSDQFLDNTSNESRKINAYYVSDFIANYSFSVFGIKEIALKAGVYNLFSASYESNGYSFGYRGGGAEFRENFYYPQAGINILGGLTVNL